MPATKSSSRERRVLRVVLVDDCEVVALGLRHLLAERPDIELIECQDCAAPEAVIEIPDDVDLILFDPALVTSPVDVAGALRWRPDLPAGRTVLYSWDAGPRVAAQALAVGARGCLSKALGGDELADALRRIARGEVLVLPEEAADGDAVAGGAALSPREVEVLDLIGRGVTNVDIACRLFISPNSVKSHVRNAYRKIGVERRSQAVRWVHLNGLTGLTEAVDPADAAEPVGLSGPSRPAA